MKKVKIVIASLLLALTGCQAEMEGTFTLGDPATETDNYIALGDVMIDENFFASISYVFHYDGEVSPDFSLFDADTHENLMGYPFEPVAVKPQQFLVAADIRTEDMLLMMAALDGSPVKLCTVNSDGSMGELCSDPKIISPNKLSSTMDSCVHIYDDLGTWNGEQYKSETDPGYFSSEAVNNYAVNGNAFLRQGAKKTWHFIIDAPLNESTLVCLNMPTAFWDKEAPTMVSFSLSYDLSGLAALEEAFPFHPDRGYLAISSRYSNCNRYTVDNASPTGRIVTSDDTTPPLFFTDLLNTLGPIDFTSDKVFISMRFEHFIKSKVQVGLCGNDDDDEEI